MEKWVGRWCLATGPSEDVVVVGQGHSWKGRDSGQSLVTEPFTVALTSGFVGGTSSALLGDPPWWWVMPTSGDCDGCSTCAPTLVAYTRCLPLPEIYNVYYITL